MATMLCLTAAACSSSNQAVPHAGADAAPPPPAMARATRTVPEPSIPSWPSGDAFDAPAATGDMAPDPGPPLVVAASRRLQCVPFARTRSNIGIRGHSWTWWNAARGRYRRGQHPRVGSVLVFRPNGRSRGHLAVVTHITSPREILVSHANWLNRGRVHLNTPIRDVSRRNDWSGVRVWYTPGGIMGEARYRTWGFIYPERQTAQRSIGLR